MTAREAARLGCALLIGMAIAFPAGLMLAGGDDDERAPRAGGFSTMRDVYSPTVLDDPYFIERQRANVEALERTCRERGEMCVEARAARRWLDSRE